VAEVEALAAALPERFRLVVLLAAWCQLRRGELLGLRRRDVDLLRGTISVEQSRTFTRDGRSLVKEPKSTAGRRTIAVPTHVLPALADHLARFTASEPATPRRTPPCATSTPRRTATGCSPMR
jgi:integrase